jgi:hypothetical protein
VKNKITRKRWKIGVQDTDTSQNVCVVSTPAELKKTHHHLTETHLAAILENWHRCGTKGVMRFFV